ncbi:hypothetical protein MRB53_039462 [Persea americana]|nr:hypothetical protein MRB53_039462 [Persea americana]
MASYSTDPEWADITPLPLDEGGTSPLAAIAYSETYAETSAYLRAVMALNEHSTRALALTADLISQNPAHYTVWLYRADTLFALQSDLREELAWLNTVALANQKNYQIWHHRNLIVDRLGDPAGEREFVAAMLDLDAKNYHVWSYRQWLVRRFALWADPEELCFTERMIAADVRNNSAWNHRWFVVNGQGRAGVGGNPDAAVGVAVDADIRAREIAFAQAAVARAPQNPSPWSYLRGIAKQAGLRLSDFHSFVQEYADLQSSDTGPVELRARFPGRDPRRGRRRESGEQGAGGPGAGSARPAGGDHSCSRCCVEGWAAAGGSWAFGVSRFQQIVSILAGRRKQSRQTPKSYPLPSQSLELSSRHRRRAGHFCGLAAIRRIMQITKLLPPALDEAGADIRPAARDDDDFLLRPHGPAEGARQAPAVAQRQVDAAGQLDQQPLVVGRAPAAHGRFGVRQHRVAHPPRGAALHAQLEGLVADPRAAQRGRLRGDARQGEVRAGVERPGQGVGALGVDDEDLRLVPGGPLRGDALHDAAEEAAAAAAADDQVRGAVGLAVDVLQLLVDLGDDGRVALQMSGWSKGET